MGSVREWSVRVSRQSGSGATGRVPITPTLLFRRVIRLWPFGQWVASMGNSYIVAAPSGVSHFLLLHTKSARGVIEKNRREAENPRGAPASFHRHPPQRAYPRCA